MLELNTIAVVSAAGKAGVVSVMAPTWVGITITFALLLSFFGVVYWLDTRLPPTK